jgi:hypothetical protein
LWLITDALVKFLLDHCPVDMIRLHKGGWMTARNIYQAEQYSWYGARFMHAHWIANCQKPAPLHSSRIMDVTGFNAWQNRRHKAPENIIVCTFYTLWTWRKHMFASHLSVYGEQRHHVCGALNLQCIRIAGNSVLVYWASPIPLCRFRSLRKFRPLTCLSRSRQLDGAIDSPKRLLLFKQSGGGDARWVQNKL